MEVDAELGQGQFTLLKWPESSRQHTDLELVLNRRMRPRMYGGAQGIPGNRAPIPIDGYVAIDVRERLEAVSRIIVTPSILLIVANGKDSKP